MKIKKVRLIGLGALGAMFSQKIQENFKGDFRVILDSERMERYKKEGIYINGEACDFDYMTPEEESEPVDVVIIGTKYSGLDAAIESVKKIVGPNTMIFTLLNGIISERLLAEAFGKEKVIYCVAQGMDAVREGNQIDYKTMGILRVGEENQAPTPRVKALTDFFDSVGIAYETPADMHVKMWSKFMFNCGVNQASLVFDTDYGGLQSEGASREAMLGAMKEVLAVAKAENIPLDESEIDYWIPVLNTLRAEGTPSMKQDADAKRYSEVMLFSGTLRQIAKKHQIAIPINEDFYQHIQELEATY